MKTLIALSILFTPATSLAFKIPTPVIPNTASESVSSSQAVTDVKNSNNSGAYSTTVSPSEASAISEGSENVNDNDSSAKSTGVFGSVSPVANAGGGGPGGGAVVSGVSANNELSNVITHHAPDYSRWVPSPAALNLVGTNCMGSAGGGATWSGGGFNIGGTKINPGCERREYYKLLKLANKDALALQVLCGDSILYVADQQLISNNEAEPECAQNKTPPKVTYIGAVVTNRDHLITMRAQ